jgi:hypothetical protein
MTKNAKQPGCPQKAGLEPNAARIALRIFYGSFREVGRIWPPLRGAAPFRGLIRGGRSGQPRQLSGNPPGWPNCCRTTTCAGSFLRDERDPRTKGTEGGGGKFPGASIRCGGLCSGKKRWLQARADALGAPGGALGLPGRARAQAETGASAMIGFAGAPQVWLPTDGSSGFRSLGGESGVRRLGTDALRPGVFD